jgi:hypothetical protein
MQSRDISCDVYYYYRRYTTDGGRIWWRYVVHASRELTSGESSGGSKVSTDGCSSTTRRQARPMPNSSPTVLAVAGRWSGRVSGAHLRICWPGVIVDMNLAPANVHDLHMAEELQLEGGGAKGGALGDRNYWSPRLTERLKVEGLDLLAPYKSKNGRRGPCPAL